MLPPDYHVHTEWSWDAPRGFMEESCEQAIRMGLPAIAFTEHADFVTIHKGQHGLNVVGYHDAVERCRAKFKELRILSGVELGEPHWFPSETAAVLEACPLDRVLGSIHCVRVGGETIDASQFPHRTPADFSNVIVQYFQETLAMIESPMPFEVLAHLDYPKRYWPDGVPPYREEDYEGELRAILTAAAGRDCVLEVNTTRGDGGERKLCPGLTVLRWWHEVGGQAVSFGSDAHEPSKVAAGFELATQVVEAAGFKPAAEPTAFWRR